MLSLVFLGSGCERRWHWRWSTSNPLQRRTISWQGMIPTCIAVSWADFDGGTWLDKWNFNKAWKNFHGYWWSFFLTFLDSDVFFQPMICDGETSWWMVKPVAPVGVVDNSRSNQRRFRLAVATTTLMNTSFLRSRRALNFGAFVAFVVFFPAFVWMISIDIGRRLPEHHVSQCWQTQMFHMTKQPNMVIQWCIWNGVSVEFCVCWESVKRSMLPVSTHWDKPHGPWKCNSGTYGSQKSHPVHPDMRWTWIPWNLTGDLPNHDTFQSNHFNCDIQALLNTAAFHNAFVLNRSQNLGHSPIHQTSNIHFSHMTSTRSSFRMCVFFGCFRSPCLWDVLMICCSTPKKFGKIWMMLPIV